MQKYGYFFLSWPFSYYFTITKDDELSSEAGVEASQIWLLIFLVSLFRSGRICYHFNCSSLKLRNRVTQEQKLRETDELTFYSVGCCCRAAAATSIAALLCVASSCMSKTADAPRQICSSRARELVFKNVLPSQLSPLFPFSIFDRE